MKLDLKYRPKTFDQVVGQKATCVILQAMIAKGALSQVLLFTGPSGVGKTSMARIIAAELNSQAATDVHEGTHPSVLEIDAASNGSVAALRDLKKTLNYASVGHKVVIIDEAHAISPEGKTVLLNMLEFPPKNVTFVLLTTEVHEIPQEVRHRCDTYTFKKASVTDLTANLTKIAKIEGIQVDSDLLNLIAQRSEGSYRESLMLLSQIWIGEITSVGQYNELHGEFDFGPTLLKSALNGPISALQSLEMLLYHITAEEITDRVVETLRDLMLIKGGVSLGYSGEALDSRMELAGSVGSDKILKAIRIMWDLQTKLTHGDPVRGLEMAFSLIGGAIGTTPSADLGMQSMQAHINQRSKESKPMSFDQLRTFKS